MRRIGSRVRGSLTVLVLVAGVASAQHDALAVGEQSAPRVLEPGELFVTANAAYERGDFETAIGLYRELLASGTGGGRVHQNLGNAYLRNGELGRAVAEFRRARRLLPRDDDVRANLAFARESARDAIAPPDPSPVLSTLLFWQYGLSPGELAAVVAVVSVLFWAAAIWRLFHRRSEVLRWASVLLLVALVGTGGSLLAEGAIRRPVAVVVPQEIEVYTAPDEQSVVRFKLHGGTEVRIRDEREGWLRIGLPDGQQGWIEAVWADIVAG